MKKARPKSEIEVRFDERRRRRHPGHDVLIDIEPPYPSGSFRFSGPGGMSENGVVVLWRGLAEYMRIEPGSIGRTDQEAMTFLRDLQGLSAVFPDTIAAIYWHWLWKTGTHVVSGMLFGVEFRADNPHLCTVSRTELAAHFKALDVYRADVVYGWLPSGAYLFPYSPGQVPPLRDLDDEEEGIEEAPEPRFFGDPGPPYKWPWGSHETDRLRKLAGAGMLWRTVAEGGNYDPADPSTAPTNEQVEHWLERNGVSGKMREAIATMLRPPELKSGPRTGTNARTPKKRAAKGADH